MVLRRVLRKGSAMGFIYSLRRVLRRVLRRGSQKEVSRRCLERPPLRKYAPLGVHPIGVNSSAAILKMQNPLGQKVAERKFPEFFEFSSRILPRILLRIFPEFFEDFSCFVSWETETRKNSPKIPAIFQCKIPRQTRKKYSNNSSGEQAK